MRALKSVGSADRFIQRVSMQGLRTAHRRRHRFDAGARHIIERVPFLQAPTRCLTMPRAKP